MIATTWSYHSLNCVLNYIIEGAWSGHLRPETLPSPWGRAVDLATKSLPLLIHPKISQIE